MVHREKNNRITKKGEINSENIIMQKVRVH
jgi:hypothetical protein